MVVIVHSRITLALRLFESIIWCRNKFICNLKLLNVAVTSERPGIYRFDGTSWPFPLIFLVRNSSTLSPFKFYMFVFQRSSRNSSRYLSTRYVKCSFNVIRFNSFKLYLRIFSSFICIDRPYVILHDQRHASWCAHILQFSNINTSRSNSTLPSFPLFVCIDRVYVIVIHKSINSIANSQIISGSNSIFQAFLCSVTSIQIKLIFQINKFYHQFVFSNISESNSTFVHLHVSRERKRIEKQVTR